MIDLITTSTAPFDYGTQEYIDITSDGAVVGRMTVLRYESGEVHIDRIDVDDEYQGRGFGTAALEAFRGAYIVADNPRAARLYARLGCEVPPASEWAMLDEGYGVYQLG